MTKATSKGHSSMNTLSDDIKKQRQELYLSALKVATNTLQEAESDSYEVSSSLLSASSSLLKLEIDKIIDTSNDEYDLQNKIRGLVNVQL